MHPDRIHAKQQWDRDFSVRLAQPCYLQRITDILSSEIEMLRQTVHDRPLKVAACETLGLPIGATIAYVAQLPLILVRKRLSPLTEDFHSTTYTDYSGTCKVILLPKKAVSPGEGIILVDEYAETGSLLRAAKLLIEEAGASVIAIACVSKSGNNGRPQRLDDIAPHVYCYDNLQKEVAPDESEATRWLVRVWKPIACQNRDLEAEGGTDVK